MSVFLVAAKNIFPPRHMSPSEVLGSGEVSQALAPYAWGRDWWPQEGSIRSIAGIEQ